ncbi:DUF1129 family protein [Lactobacillus sp. YT155]|uniref:DUF1129 family protein n=1 Tax=Lactobacillus sp. YT155 TaxID=3060955 RepID=UPI00265DEC27|nr:DUF1129 family protein [Lactobacillus sp. YT155]MDO1604957.1 DUF1129 family protein [Lactobacillus sp. YT155]
MSEKAKEKNKEIIEKQAKNEEVKKKVNEAEVATQDMSADEIAKKLSKRNDEYLFKLRKELIAAGKTEEEAKEMIDGLVRDIYLSQIKGITANKLFGTPTEKVEDLLTVKKKVNEKQPFWKLAVDTTLLFLALFAAMYGVMGLTDQSKKPQNQTGILTLLTISIMWGVILTWFNIQMKKSKENRPGIGKTLVYMAGGLVLMFGVLYITANLPAVINPVLDPTIYLVTAIVSFAGRYIFRKMNNIKTSALF